MCVRRIKTIGIMNIINTFITLDLSSLNLIIYIRNAKINTAKNGLIDTDKAKSKPDKNSRKGDLNLSYNIKIYNETIRKNNPNIMFWFSIDQKTKTEKLIRSKEDNITAALFLNNCLATKPENIKITAVRIKLE